MHTKRFISGTNETVSIENSWQEENKEDNIHAIGGMIILGIIVFSKIVIMF